MANTIDTMLPEVILRKIIDGSFSGEFEDDTITSLGPYRLANLSQVTTVRLNNLTTTTGHSNFVGNTNMEWLFIPKLKTMGAGAYDSFAGSNVLEYLAFPSLSRATLLAAFLNKLPALEAVDFGPSLTGLGNANYVLGNNSNYQIIIFRRTSVVSMLNSNCFASSRFKSGGAGGTIYIPKVLYDELGTGSSLDYKSATNWSIYDGYGTITWAQIEGSYYETHYADGTEIL